MAFGMKARALVLDTNIVLDLLVFHDPATVPLRQALLKKDLHWIATRAMRDELERVLDYPQIVRRMEPGSQWGRATAGDAAGAVMPSAGAIARQILDSFDAQTSIVPAAPKATVSCRDPDDQKFIDQAVAHQALLLSKDKAVLCMRKRLLTFGVLASVAI
ncbi:MAG TPA: PIN domain-containing protein [Rhodoferax sp.]|nr:PIN domain-containing protein [Rhodoferax sp.]